MKTAVEEQCIKRLWVDYNRQNSSNQILLDLDKTKLIQSEIVPDELVVVFDDEVSCLALIVKNNNQLVAEIVCVL